MANYFILNDKRPNPNFDAHVHGLLLNNKRELIANPFNKGDLEIPKIKYIVRETVKYSETGIYRDKLSVTIQNNEPLFVCSSRLQTLLNEFCKNVEFYDLVVKKNDKINEDFKLANITSFVECINHTESKLIYWEMSHQTVYNIDELVLKEESIPKELNMFLLGGIRGAIIIIHRKLKEAIESAKLTGFTFFEINEFVL